MGNADYFRLGDWNAVCDRCGRKRKGSELRLTWNNLWVCPEKCWEPRQPQDFVRAVRENPTPPFVRNPADIIISYCTPNGRTALPGFGVPGCMIPGFTDPAFDPSIVEAIP